MSVLLVIKYMLSTPTETLLNYLKEMGYRNIREVPWHWFCGINDMMFTYWVFCHLDNDMYGAWYQYRYCFPKELWLGNVEHELAKWDGEDDIGWPWIKKKGLRYDEVNPNYDSIFKK